MKPEMKNKFLNSPIRSIPLSLFLLSIFCFCLGAGISAYKTMMLGTDNTLPSNETTFFSVNSNLLNASVAGGGPIASLTITNAAEGFTRYNSGHLQGSYQVTAVAGTDIWETNQDTTGWYVLNRTRGTIPFHIDYTDDVVNLNGPIATPSITLGTGSGVNFFTPSNHVLSLSALAPSPQVTILESNWLSPSNLWCKFAVDLESSAASTTPFISNAWPFALGAGTNQFVYVNWQFYGQSPDGTVTIYSTTIGACGFTNNGVGAGQQVSASDPSTTGTGSVTKTRYSSLTGWKINITPPNSTATHWTAWGDIHASY